MTQPSNQTRKSALPPPGPLIGTFDLGGVRYLFHECGDSRVPEHAVEVFRGAVGDANRVTNFGVLWRAMLKALDKKASDT